MSESPKVEQLVLFKHGVAYVERGGPADATFALSFKLEEMNDVLKSLAVWVANGEGTVRSVAFAAPEDPRDELESRGLALGGGAEMHQLLAAFRGRAIEVDDGHGKKAGEIVGVQKSERRGDGSVPDRLLLRSSAGSIDMVSLDAIRSVRLVDERAQADLALLVEKSREATARERRTVRVHLDRAASDVRAAYIVPAPMWRVSYRLVVEEGDDGERCTVMAWAIVHNPIDEDLEGVELTLTTGQPMSFVIDLYRPRHVARAVLEESDRGAAPPRPVKRARAAAMPPPPAGAPGIAVAGPQGGSFGGYAAQALEMADATDTSERSELFDYRVKTPFSVARGGSAMVPLTGAKVRCERRRLWRDGQGPHPDVVLKFENATGVVLEEGAAVIYDDGYAGESMLPYSARGAEVSLAFSKDLSIRCSDRTKSEQHAYHVKFGSSAVVESWEHSLTHTLRASSDHDDAVTVLFEVPRHHGRELASDAPTPIEELDSLWRFALEVPARGEATLEVVERWRTAYNVATTSITHDKIRDWIRTELLSDAEQSELTEVMRAWVERDQKLAEAKVAQAQLDQTYRAQESISAQLAVLKEGGSEGALRARYANELAEHQDRIAALNEKVRALGEDAAQRDAAARAALEGLGAKK
ncbi:MAG: hypothetical protein AB7S26_00285 [Sandaracinaceae bacterium]